MITASAGFEYLSSVTSGNTMPFFKLSIRPVPKMIITGEFTYLVRAKAILNYRFASNFQLEVNYTKYNKEQKAIYHNYLEERRLLLSFPVSFGRILSFSRISVNQIVLPVSKYTYGEYIFSFNAHRLNSNITTNAFFTNQWKAAFNTNIALNYRLYKKLFFKPQFQYDYSRQMFTMAKTAIEKYIFSRGFVNLSYETNFYSKTNSVGVGFRYDFSFAQTSFAVRQTHKTTSVVQSARGSLLYDSKGRYTRFDNRSSIGKGGMLVVPFLDINRNGKRDAGEPKAEGLNFTVNGGSTECIKKDTTFRVFDLEPYINYLVKIDANGFDNIAWQIQKHTISVQVEPNNFKLVEIPVLIMGEVSGNVFLKNKNGNKSLGRITVAFFNSDSTSSFRAVTESDGYFSLLGLPPGFYTARIDSKQLKKLNMTSTPTELKFRISASREGDLIDGLEFILESAINTTP
jgi:hypothetical protein